MKVLHVGDLHLGSQAPKVEEEMLAMIERRAAAADVVILGGDMTNEGKHEEYAALGRLIGRLGSAKCLPVRGNHDMGFFMERTRSALPNGISYNFDPRPYPAHQWMANWFNMIPNTCGRFDLPQRVPAPYDRMQQAPVFILYDGVGPYYAVERGGYKFIILDSCSWLLGDRQYEFLRRELASAAVPVVLVLHHNILPVGSIFDGAILWDREPLLDLLLEEPKILAVLSAHVHSNRVWKFRGKHVVTTGDRGWSRLITLNDGKVADVEPLGNHMRPGSGAWKVCEAAENPTLPFEHRCEYAVDTIAKDSFTCFNSGLWDSLALGWHASDGPGGLVWRFRACELPSGQFWLGLNFRSTTPWRVTVDADGRTLPGKDGAPGDNLVVTLPLDPPRMARCQVRLEQQAPASGHASPFLVFNQKPVTGFCNYI